MNLTVTSESAERRLRRILENFFVSFYDEDALPSHGLSHHQRVWQYARQLVALPCRQDLALETDPEDLIIACFLHDIGMSDDPGPSHGKKSREICDRFLSLYCPEKQQSKLLPETIEHHDRKDYTNHSSAPALFIFLSVADDLDAFGYTGIYRYSEIYLKRGIEPELLADKVLSNSQNRFRYLLDQFGCADSFVSHHQIRFNILNDFFIQLQNQIPGYHFSLAEPEGYCGVISLIMKMVSEKMPLQKLLYLSDEYSGDVIISRFFSGLKTEMGS
jgi:hypothetical protein